MYDVLLQLCNLSNTLQNQNAIVAEFHNSMEVTKKNPEHSKREYDEEGKVRFEGVKLKEKDHAFKSSKNKFLEVLQSSFDDCFEDIEEGVLRATSAISFKTWPDKENSEAMAMKTLNL